ncbi:MULTISPECIES: hypothetical protein [Arthrobacter]|uniref:Uncharacterized protein n=1 Tax=Arthrobacter terricola TaxID=2547396 RepID=A0A4R5KA26_9MICC|nr:MULTISPECIES: hypothetical protein [Arthrobacter]MBT8163130.1 hypothetical protein [Arthrobacter sp. GN70]TDF91298.1 hypothetical protein E1809_21295 [Arthrobacter terricola]
MQYPQDSFADARHLPGRPAILKDWALAKGELVEVRHHELPPREGLVDEVTPDGVILWLAAEGATTRRMIDKSEGFEVWVSA